MKLIIDELESELDDLKSGNKKINNKKKGKKNGKNTQNVQHVQTNFSNTGINTNRLKQLSVTLNNTSLINHLKKENERLRKLVVTYEFKNKRFYEEKKIKFKQNLININNQFYFSIINTPINTNTNTNVNTNVNTNENTNANTNVNSNSMILINNNEETDNNNSTEKIKNENEIINNKNNDNSYKNNIDIESKNKTCDRESKIYKLIKDINNYALVNSNKNIDNNKLKENINTGNYIKIVDNNKKKRNNLSMNKRNNIGKERTCSLIQRHRNTAINNINTKLNNYDTLSKTKYKSKNDSSSNNNNNRNNISVISHSLKNQNKDKSKESRNHSKGVGKYFNKSFNESLIDQKYFNTMNNINNNTGKNIAKNKTQNNHPKAIRLIDNNEKSKKEFQDFSLNISKEYDYDDDRIIKRPNLKDGKSNQEEAFNFYDNSGNDIILLGNKNTNITNNTNNTKGAYSEKTEKTEKSEKKDDCDTSNKKIFNSDIRKKKSDRITNNKKRENSNNINNINA